MARKGRNIYKRKDGRWEGRLKTKVLESKGPYKSFYGRTYGEVKEKMTAYIKCEENNHAKNRITLNEAVKIWMKDKRPAWKQSTYACYMQIAEKFIFPELGSTSCEKITNHTIMEFQKKHGALSRAYLKSICGIIVRCLKHMNTIYGENFTLPVCTVVYGQKRSVTGSGRETTTPTPESLRILETYLSEHLEDSTCAGILLAMYTGIRIGELCALKWTDVDLVNGVLTIRQTMQRVRHFDKAEKTQIRLDLPKSDAAVRSIPIPITIRTKLADRPYVKEGFLIKGSKKDFAEPRTLQYRFEVILKNCGIPRFNFHRLRHAFASVCLMKGFDFKSLSELMGHASIQTTMNIYVHSNEARKKALMEQLNIFDAL